MSETIFRDDPEAIGPWGTAGMLACLSWFFLFTLGAAGQPHVVTKMMMTRRVEDVRHILPLSVIGYSLTALLWVGIGLAMRTLVLQGEHSPLDDAAWGRGNGFPALGIAWSLTELPENAPGRAEMLQVFRAHMEALTRHQDPTGAWHQVIDKPESYRELTATSMIALAMARGVRLGWLDRAKYDPVIQKAWYALRTRIAPDGGLVDVCTGTGKQKTLRDYYDRPAILGPDPRGGGMALLIATEMERYERFRQAR